MTLQALIFDFDGLIVDTETPGFVSWQELYQEFDRALKLEDWTHATGYVGGFDPALHLEKLLGRKIDWTELARKRDARNWELTLQAPVLPGIERLMRSAKANQLPLGVASNSGTGWVEDGLVRLGLRDLIDVVITRDMVLSPKPAPDIYLKAAQTLRVDPVLTVALEDSEPGCRSAKQAGLSVVAIPNQFSERQELSVADLIVKSAAELTLEGLDELVTGSRQRFTAD
jgi:HAD superfamily hydrolase (TIGR01509 family)